MMHCAQTNHTGALCTLPKHDPDVIPHEFPTDAAEAERAVQARANAEALADWWTEDARQAIERTVPKATEYSGTHGGENDMVWIGEALAYFMGRQVSHEEATELGTFFYLLGKMARWRSAIREGRRVSDDTLFDIKVYATMARRNRDVGGWPFGADE